jgi:putative FmdB family regulatory protein
LPTYEYHCDSCDRNFDVVQSFHDEPLETCPTCGSPVRKVFGSVGIVFKGSGFYKTDSRSGSGSASRTGESTAPAATSSGEGSAPSGSESGSGSGSGSDTSADKPASTDKPSSTPAPVAKPKSTGGSGGTTS